MNEWMDMITWIIWMIVKTPKCRNHQKNRRENFNKLMYYYEFLNNQFFEWMKAWIMRYIFEKLNGFMNWVNEWMKKWQYQWKNKMNPSKNEWIMEKNEWFELKEINTYVILSYWPTDEWLENY